MSTQVKRVMLVDDDETIIETLEYNLKRHGFATVVFNNGTAALAGLDGAGPDLIILDWLLPDMVGPEICKVVRSKSVSVPILMLTGRANPNDVAAGLTAGADDYLSKPFSVVELMARVQALLRRTGAQVRPEKIELGPLTLDDAARLVSLKGRSIDLSPKEFALLRALMRNAGKALSTETLLNEVWGVDFTGDVKTLAVHMRWLRQKLEDDPRVPTLLETVHKVGYRLNRP